MAAHPEPVEGSEDIVKVTKDIAAVEAEIKSVEAKIDAVEEKIDGEDDPEEKKALREKEKALREKEKALREETKALREEKMFLLQRGNSGLSEDFANLGLCTPARTGVSSGSVDTPPHLRAGSERRMWEQLADLALQQRKQADDIAVLKSRSDGPSGSQTCAQLYNARVNAQLVKAAGPRGWRNSGLVGKSFQLPTLPDKNECSETKVVQPWWGALASVSASLGSRSLVDTHASALPGMHLKRPDMGLFASDSPSVFNFILPIELKGGVGTFANSDRGEILEYTELLLRVQPWRAIVYGLLANGRELAVLRSTRGAENVAHVWVTEANLDNDEGREVLCAMLTASDQSLGYVLPRVHIPAEIFGDDAGGPEVHLSLSECLGAGSSAVVFAARLKSGAEVVVKAFHANREEHYQDEVRALVALTGITGLPRMLHTNDGVPGPPVIVQTPRGHAFRGSPLDPDASGRYISPNDVAALVDVLRQAHERGWVHRDVAASNFFGVGSDGVLLNDWGCAVKLGDEVAYRGVGIEASPRLLELLKSDGGSATYVPRPQDDLHALARSVYRILASPPREMFLTNGERDFSKIETFWQSQVGECWLGVFALAGADPLDYTAFALKLGALVDVTGAYRWSK